MLSSNQSYQLLCLSLMSRRCFAFITDEIYLLFHFKPLHQFKPQNPETIAVSYFPFLEIPELAKIQWSSNQVSFSIKIWILECIPPPSLLLSSNSSNCPIFLLLKPSFPSPLRHLPTASPPLTLAFSRSSLLHLPNIAAAFFRLNQKH